MSRSRNWSPTDIGAVAPKRARARAKSTWSLADIAPKTTSPQPAAAADDSGAPVSVAASTPARDVAVMTTPEPVAADAPKPAARPRGRKGKAGPDVIDVHVGQRLRIARTLRGLSQGDLGAAIGLTFQQIQKYERGSNRISAGTLFRLGNALDVPVSYFFDGAGEAGPNVAAGLDGVADRGALRTASAIQRVPNAGVRDALSALVQALADAGNADESGAVKD